MKTKNATNRCANLKHQNEHRTHNIKIKTKSDESDQKKSAAKTAGAD